MQKLIVTYLGFVLLLCGAHTFALDLDITTETKDCNGVTGFSSFKASHIQKIQSADCYDPDNPNAKLQQVFITSPLFPGSFDVVWVTVDGAELIKQQVREGRTIEIERYQRPDIEVDVRHYQGSASQQKGSSTSAVSRAAVSEGAANAKLMAQTNTESSAEKHTPKLSIKILDPNLPLTRSTQQVVASSKTKNRAVVGKIEASEKIVSLTVNGESVNFEDSGIFKAAVPLTNSKTPVEVVAIDELGNRADFTFYFLQKSKAKTPSSKAGFGNYKALIIANTDYEHMDKLVTPSNDAEILKSILDEQYGFETEVVSNASRYTLLTRLNELRASLTQNDNLLIYYAGHGTLDKKNKRGHWLPVDAEPSSTANWVSASEISDIINAMSAKHVLLVADSCYSGALTRTAETKLDPGMDEDEKLSWYQTMAESRSRYVLTSGGERPVMDDGGNGHSIFAAALIQILSNNTEILTGSSMAESLKARVSKHAEAIGTEQEPMFSSLPGADHEFGEFLFVANAN